MTLQEFYNTLRYHLEEKNVALTPTEYNALIKKVNLQKWAKERAIFEEDQRNIEAVAWMKKLRIMPLSSGRSALPSDYGAKVSIKPIIPTVCTIASSKLSAASIPQNYTEVVFAELEDVTGVVVGTSYYVINASATDFQVSATLGGTPITITLGTDPVASFYVKSGTTYDVDAMDIQVVREDYLASLLRSSLYAPSEEEPVAVFRGSNIQVYPPTLPYAELIYLAKPVAEDTEPNYVFVIDTTSELPAYDSDASIEFGWPVTEHLDLLNMMARELGIEIQEPASAGSR